MPPFEYAIAVWNDFLMAKKYQPLAEKDWQELKLKAGLNPTEKAILQKKNFREDIFEFQVYLIAQWGLILGLFEEIPINGDPSSPWTPSQALLPFFKSIRGLPGELLQGSIFRQEEALRCWAEAFARPIDEEKKSTSAGKLKQMNYLNSLFEAERAEKKLEQELKRRETVIAELKKQAEYDRGNYE
jgi:hypothetical protein